MGHAQSAGDSVSESIYAWRRCDHSGIGLPGCDTCDRDNAPARNAFWFGAGEMFDCCDNGDALSCTSAAEAVEELLQQQAEPGDTNAALCRRLAPIEVAVYVCSDTTAHFQGAAECLFEKLSEDFADQFADPNSGPEKAGKHPEVMRHLEEAVAAFARQAHVWSCEQVVTLRLSAAEALVLVGED